MIALAQSRDREALLPLPQTLAVSSHADSRRRLASALPAVTARSSIHAAAAVPLSLDSSEAPAAGGRLPISSTPQLAALVHRVLQFKGVKLSTRMHTASRHTASVHTRENTKLLVFTEKPQPSAHSERLPAATRAPVQSKWTRSRNILLPSRCHRSH